MRPRMLMHKGLVLVLGLLVLASWVTCVCWTSPRARAEAGEADHEGAPRLVREAFFDARLCRVRGEVVFPQECAPAKPFSLKGQMSYRVRNGRWVSVEGEGVKTLTKDACALVRETGTFEVWVPQASSVTFWRDYDFGEPHTPYVVAPQSFEVPLGKAEHTVRLKVTIPPGADSLFALEGRVLDATTGEAMAGLMVVLQQYPPGEKKPGRIPRPQQGQRSRACCGTQYSPSAEDGGFRFTVPKMPGYTYLLQAEPPLLPELQQRRLAWSEQYGRPELEIPDIGRYEGEPLIWNVPRRNPPSLTLEYRTMDGAPMPLPEGKILIRGLLRNTEKPQDTIVETEDGLKIEYRYEIIGTNPLDGGPAWQKKTLVHLRDGSVVQRSVEGLRLEDLLRASIVRLTPEGSVVQAFYELPAGRYRVAFVHQDIDWKPVKEDEIIDFEPRPGETVHKVIRVEPRTEKAQPASDAKP